MSSSSSSIPSYTKSVIDLMKSTTDVHKMSKDVRNIMYSYLFPPNTRLRLNSEFRRIVKRCALCRCHLCVDLNGENIIIKPSLDDRICDECYDRENKPLREAAMKLFKQTNNK